MYLLHSWSLTNLRTLSRTTLFTMGVFLVGRGLESERDRGSPSGHTFPIFSSRFSVTVPKAKSNARWLLRTADPVYVATLRYLRSRSPFWYSWFSTEVAETLGIYHSTTPRMWVTFCDWLASKYSAANPLRSHNMSRSGVVLTRSNLNTFQSSLELRRIVRRFDGTHVNGVIISHLNFLRFNSNEVKLKSEPCGSIVSWKIHSYSWKFHKF